MCISYKYKLCQKFPLKSNHPNYLFYCFKCVRWVRPNLSSAPCIWLLICKCFANFSLSLKFKVIHKKFNFCYFEGMSEKHFHIYFQMFWFAFTLYNGQSRVRPESIEWLKENQAISTSYDLAPPPLLPPSPVSKPTGDIQEDRERETTCWRERGEGAWGGAKSYDGEKAWSSINHSILPGRGWWSIITPPHHRLVSQWVPL